MLPKLRGQYFVKEFIKEARIFPIKYLIKKSDRQVYQKSEFIADFVRNSLVCRYCQKSHKLRSADPVLRGARVGGCDF
jgi:hypothetical protein